MRSDAKLPESEKVLELWRSGMTYSQLAAQYGVTKQAVENRIRALGYRNTPEVRRRQSQNGRDRKEGRNI